MQSFCSCNQLSLDLRQNFRSFKVDLIDYIKKGLCTLLLIIKSIELYCNNNNNNNDGGGGGGGGAKTSRLDGFHVNVL